LIVFINLKKRKEGMHKKYIIKNGKRFGPYYYENYREGGKVKTR